MHTMSSKTSHKTSHKYSRYHKSLQFVIQDIILGKCAVIRHISQGFAILSQHGYFNYVKTQLPQYQLANKSHYMFLLIT